MALTPQQFSNKPDRYLTVDSNKRFSYEQVKQITSEFQTPIGEGGFGTVYYGKYGNDNEVAVKKLSESSHQGNEQFQTEVKMLTKVHHKYLVSLVGFCEEFGSHCMLLYEYMPLGDLRRHLYGKEVVEPLTWQRRLSIALNAAEGLEYLHKKCVPAIIHRDVKSSNILLTKSYIAKVADFGLSKLFDDEDATHVTTKIQGTLGYLDPEYHRTGQLTEKSDVYSFGVVLWEIICGRAPINATFPRDQINLVEWAHRCMNTGRLEEIVDPRLGTYNTEAMWKVAETGMLSTQFEAMLRPNMSEVVMSLKEATQFENATQQSETSLSGTRALYLEIEPKACSTDDSSAPRVEDPFLEGR